MYFHCQLSIGRRYMLEVFSSWGYITQTQPWVEALSLHFSIKSAYVYGTDVFRRFCFIKTEIMYLKIIYRLGDMTYSKLKFLTFCLLFCQGGEWDYVIFSTARSLPEYRIEKHPTLGWCKQNLGFITDEHQINVALTRARRGLIIIGRS